MFYFAYIDCPTAAIAIYYYSRTADNVAVFKVISGTSLFHQEVGSDNKTKKQQNKKLNYTNNNI